MSDDQGSRPRRPLVFAHADATFPLKRSEVPSTLPRGSGRTRASSGAHRRYGLNKGMLATGGGGGIAAR